MFSLGCSDAVREMLKKVFDGGERNLGAVVPDDKIHPQLFVRLGTLNRRLRRHRQIVNNDRVLQSRRNDLPQMLGLGRVPSAVAHEEERMLAVELTYHL